VGAAWATRTPTITLEPGVHHGPLVIDEQQTLVGKPGAVVRGGIVITADDVTVRGVTVLAGDYGISVDGAKGVLIDDVRVSGATLDGINVRRSSVTIRDCVVTSTADYAQGIDISFGFDLAPSTVRGCTVTGGQEGIVTHFAHVRLVGNRVVGASLRGITVTEMSMAEVERNSVERSLGVGIYCGDYSMCNIEENFVSDTASDIASGNRTRLGFAILAHFGATATVEKNRIVRSPGGIASSLRSRILSE
jgi:nitrous oxidase accessory protein NosD